MDCTVCNGMGTIPNRATYARTGANYAAPTRPCSECGGTGKAPEVEAVTATAEATGTSAQTGAQPKQPIS
ncbi:MAG: hypothetical protein Q8O53_03715 [Candidatus Moranbacteria bacterium]|nr:hypothetical protein [Candidatus Moranbacteria bacterium]